MSPALGGFLSRQTLLDKASFFKSLTNVPIVFFMEPCLVLLVYRNQAGDERQLKRFDHVFKEIVWVFMSQSMPCLYRLTGTNNIWQSMFEVSLESAFLQTGLAIAAGLGTYLRNHVYPFQVE